MWFQKFSFVFVSQLLTTEARGDRPRLSGTGQLAAGQVSGRCSCGRAYDCDEYNPSNY
ncbi:hypothetical protein [Nostoc sp. UIC 10630]|uniref:hypothetical protein n=1 Tax=Nostoc sp. UIC 10630 TaxID=2100146 RepID=UPI0013D2ED0D|nr:hypothetical protein [Nostoc sp. UIC 10630]NEU82694.1 hypothetical protein [Nostoc sp. UIC 10630]